MFNKIDTKSHHATKAGSNIFSDLGFEPEYAKQLLAESNMKIAKKTTHERNFDVDYLARKNKLK